MSISRRSLIKTSAWAVPIVSVAVSTPLAAASTTPRIPISCEELAKGVFLVSYNDGTTETLGQGQVNRDKALQAMCRDKGPLS